MIPQPGKPFRGSLFRLPPIFLSLLLLVGLVGSGFALAADQKTPVSTYQLLPGIKAEIQADGTLVLWGDQSREPLLTARVPVLGHGRRSRSRGTEPELFQALLAEGAPGGQRGFSSGADDDGDGLVDEDQRDGRDNDGDGLVDEDFAAISDDMTVVHRREDSTSVHLESYHWSNPGLRPAVFLALASDRVDLVGLELAASEGYWTEIDFSSVRHSVTGRSVTHENHAFVTKVGDSSPGQDSPDSALWLGAMVLGDRPGYLVHGTDHGTELVFPLSETPLPLVICVARSWLQLTHALTESDLVYRGVTDPLSKRTAGWIVPAPCSHCRDPQLPVFSRLKEDNQNLVLKMDFLPGQLPLVDPDLFILAGQRLGPPSEITWRPTLGISHTLAWHDVTLAGLRGSSGGPGIPYTEYESLFVGHETKPKQEGSLEFRFTGAHLKLVAPGGILAGTWLDGRSFRAEIMAPGKPTASIIPALGSLVESQPGITVNPASKAETRQNLTLDRHPPTLAAKLLEGWPNPFRDVIQIKFKVPETVGEAFEWVDEADVPKDLDRQASVPWKGGSPTASIKIYNINGQELMTLHDSAVSRGEVTLNWNGTDIFGRQVASGTYFCKLQLDEWSVTRRIVYLR